MDKDLLKLISQNEQNRAKTWEWYQSGDKETKSEFARFLQKSWERPVFDAVRCLAWVKFCELVEEELRQTEAE